jgi:propionyl-CoA carboxylase alpha chain
MKHLQSFLWCLLSIPTTVAPHTLVAQVAVVEAMKMRNVLRAEVDGVVGAVEAEAGAVVAADQVIVRFS